MRNSCRIGVAIIGCGYWGPRLARNFYKFSELRWVFDLQMSRARDIASQYPQVRVAAKIEDILADPQVEAVAIATPVNSHYSLTKKCLLAGRHVFVEKPMAASVAECDELIELAKQNGLILMVDHTFIYTGAVRKMRDLVAAGDLGKIYYFDSVRVNLGLFQHDINVLWDLAPHDLSIMDYVLEKRPVAISAQGACHLPGSSIENIAYLTLLFSDDTIAHFHVNWLAPAKVRRIILGGSRKMLVFDDLSQDEKIKIYDKGLLLNEHADSSEILAGYRIGDLYVPRIESTEALAVGVEHFLNCMKTGTQPESDGSAGRWVVTVLEAAQKSLAQRGEMTAL